MNGRIVRAEKTVTLPVISKIKIGEKVPNSDPQKRDFCRSLDYFIGFGKYKSLFDKAFPDKPNKIQILFVSDDINFCCNERLELRNNKGDLFGKSDGQTFQIFSDKTKAYETFSIKDHPDIIEKSQARTGTEWKRVLTLRFIVPAIKGVLGLWQVDTKADKSSIDQIRDTFDYVLSQAGTVTRVLFDLTVTKVKSQKPNDPSSYPVLNLIPNVSDDNLNILREFVEAGKLSNIRSIDDAMLLEMNSNKPKQLEQTIETEENLFT